MKHARLEELYHRRLRPPEESKKELPLAHILKQPTVFYPERPDRLAFDIVEIGPGTGDFLFHLAQKYPTKKLLGIEIGKKRFQKIKARLEKWRIKNVTLLCADARVPFYNDFKKPMFEKCFVLFPDPWPKNRHAHLRLLQPDFLKQVVKTLKPGGEFTLGTDVKDYATWVLDNLSMIREMKNDLGEARLATDLPDVIPTFFKKKWEKMGRGFWFLRFRKLP